MKRYSPLLVLLAALLFACAGPQRLERTGSATNLTHWNSGDVFTEDQANQILDSIDDNYNLIHSHTTNTTNPHSVTRDQIGIDQSVSTTASPSWQSVTIPGLNGLTLGSAFTTNGKITLKNSSNASTVSILPGPTASTYSITLPTAPPVSNGYLMVMSTGGVISLLDPSTIAGGSGVVVSRTDCSSETSGGCIDSTGNLYVWNGSQMGFVGPIASADLDLAQESIFVGNLSGKAAAVPLVKDLSSEPGSDGSAPSALAVYTEIHDHTTSSTPHAGHLPFLQSRTISDPADADDHYWFKAPAALTLSSFDCIADGSSPSIAVDVQECDAAGSNCSSILSSAVTANGGNDAGTISDTSIASGAWVKVLLGVPSGTVSSITFTLKGVQ